MTELAGEIARIAALRGKSIANYEQIDRESRRLTATQVRAIFRVPDNSRGELRAYDALPERSRMVLSDLPINASAMNYAQLLRQIRDEGALIRAVRDVLPGVLRDWVLDHYGRNHPSTRKLA